MIIGGLWRYGDWRHVATGCNALAIINSVASGTHCVKAHIRYLISWWVLVLNCRVLMRWWVGFDQVKNLPWAGLSAKNVVGLGFKKRPISNSGRMTDGYDTFFTHHSRIITLSGVALLMAWPWILSFLVNVKRQILGLLFPAYSHYQFENQTRYIACVSRQLWKYVIGDILVSESNTVI